MIDAKSLQILKILQQKARVPNVEVAREVNMAPSAVLERIRKMEKKGIIDGYEVILNPKRFNKNLVAFVHVYMKNSLNMQQIGDALVLIPEIQEIHFITGKDCYFLKMRVSNIKELNEILEKKISTIEYVRKTETSLALSTLKETSQIPLDLANISKSGKEQEK